VRKKMRNMGVFVAAVLAVIASSVGVAQARNGVQVGQFAYVFENDQWLADIANSAVTPEPPEFIVLNIGNGQTDDVGHLDTIAQSIMARGTKVYGYVDANPSRSNNDIAIDAGRYINPYNPERNNYSRMVDGIFLDQHPRDCGPIETPTNNPSNDSDWIYKYSSITGNVRSQFSFWSYPTALVMANVGTAVNGCHPGWGNFGQPVPDYYVTFEGDAATYASSYLGGNMIDGTPAYVDGNYYFPERFVHIVYDVDAVDVKDTLRLADQRGAHSVYLTDDVASNPYDSPPSYLQQSITDARVSPTTFEDGFSGGSSYGLGSSEVGFGTAYDGFGAVTSQQVFTHDGGGPGVDPSTSPWVARILEIAEDECGVAPADAEWGDVGSLVDSDTGSPNYYPTLSGLGTIDTDFVGCMHDLFVDNGSGLPNEPMAYICNDYVTTGPVSTNRDCRSTDGANATYENVNEAATAYFRAAMANTSDVGRMLELIRDRLVEDDTNGDCASAPANRRCIRIFNTGSFNRVTVLVFSNDSTIVSATGGTVNWAAGSIGTPDP
jgi:hypothetical protein